MKIRARNLSGNVVGAAVIVGLNLACASVPKDAPQEFHAARAVIDSAEDEGVEDILPVTMEKAENDFDQALTMWKDAQDEKSSQKSASMKTEATKMAQNADELAGGARVLKRNIGSWDQDLAVLEGEYSIPSLLGQVRNMKKEMAQQDVGIATPFAKISGLKFQGPVAYFETNAATLDSYYHPAIAEVASLIKLDPNLMVTVSGYADIRGTEKHNDELTKRRAETVAAILEQYGVASNQVSIAPMGKRLAHFKQREAKLQLDRRVDVTVTVRPAEKVSH